MWFLNRFMLIVPSVLILGEEYCSQSDRNINCTSCAKICGLQHSPCSNVFRCPEQCDDSEGRQFCHEVCQKQCIDGRCEYEEGGLKCSEGCRDNWAGKHCLTRCSSGCRRCHRFNLACLECVNGYYNCESVTTVLTTPSPVTTRVSFSMKEAHTSIATRESTVTPLSTLTVTRETTTSNSYHGTSPLTSPSNKNRNGEVRSHTTEVLILGILGGAVATLIIGTTCYMLIRKLPRFLDRNMNISLVHESEDSHCGYTYINDNDLDPISSGNDSTEPASIRSHREGHNFKVNSVYDYAYFSNQVMPNVQLAVHCNWAHSRNWNPVTIPHRSQSVPLENTVLQIRCI